MSETFDGFRRQHPVVAHLVVIVFAGHLLRLLPVDPLAGLMNVLARMIGPLR